MISNYFNEMRNLMNIVENTEMNSMKEAAELLAECIRNDGIIHLFGCGHSHILTEEVYYRAGGLVPIHPILHEPLMLHEGAVKSSEIERKNSYADSFMDKQDIRENDILIVISTSGRNPVPIDVAKIGKEQGAKTIGITSRDYSASQPSRHSSGHRLYEAVGLVLDNHAPPGDAMLTHEKVDIKFSPSSTVIGSLILNSVIAETIAVLAENDDNPPVFLSGNIDGSDDHNNSLIKKYSDRINL